jgi:hypothetical protein
LTDNHVNARNFVAESAIAGAFGLGSLLAASDAAAQPLVFAAQPTVPLVAVDVDLGGSLAPGGEHRTWFGRIGAGLSLWNGARLIDVTAEWGGWRNQRTTLGLATRYLSAHTGLGATATVVREVGQNENAWGAGAGVSFSVVNLQAIVFASDPHATRVQMFVRMPLGLMAHELLKAWRAKNPKPPTPARP